MDVETPAAIAESNSNLDSVPSGEATNSGDSVTHAVEVGTGESNSMDVVVEKVDGEPEMRSEGGVPEMAPNEAENEGKQDENKVSSLAEARAALQQPDAILEDEVFTNIKAFFDAGGSPPEIIKSLSGSYRGFPQMVNLVSFWLRRAGVPENEIVSLVESHIRDEIQVSFDPQKADRIFGMGSVRSVTNSSFIPFSILFTVQLVEKNSS